MRGKYLLFPAPLWLNTFFDPACLQNLQSILFKSTACLCLLPHFKLHALFLMALRCKDNFYLSFFCPCPDNCHYISVIGPPFRFVIAGKRLRIGAAEFVMMQAYRFIFLIVSNYFTRAGVTIRMSMPMKIRSSGLWLRNSK